MLQTNESSMYNTWTRVYLTGYSYAAFQTTRNLEFSNLSLKNIHWNKVGADPHFRSIGCFQVEVEELHVLSYL